MKSAFFVNPLQLTNTFAILALLSGCVDNEDPKPSGTTSSMPTATGGSGPTTTASTTGVGGAIGTAATTSAGGATGTPATTSTGSATGTPATTSTGGATGTPNTQSTVPGDASTLVKAMGIGTNIGNTFDNTSVWETGWGQPLVTQTYIKGMASRGIKTVRVPVAWDTYAKNGVIASDKMARVSEVVHWIIDAGMFAVVNIHWDGGWINKSSTAAQYQLTDTTRTKFASYWTQIATTFADVDHHLILEAMNEEGAFYVGGNQSNAPDYAPLNELNQSFVTTVRKGGGYNATRALLIAGFNTDIEKTCVDAFKIPTDPAGTGKLFLSVHYYTPSSFTILDKPANYWADVWTYPATTWGTAAEKTELQTLFDKLIGFSTNRKLPIILGEFAVAKGAEPYVRESASRILWMKTVISTSLTSGEVVPVLWDTGSEISRTDGSFSSDFQSVMTQLGQ